MENIIEKIIKMLEKSLKSIDCIGCNFTKQSEIVVTTQASGNPRKKFNGGDYSFYTIYTPIKKGWDFETSVFEVSYDTLTNMEKTAVLLEKDSIINSQNELIQKLPVKPEVNAKPIQWVDYIIAILSILVVWGLSWIKKLQNINNPIIQRLVSETSSFIVKIQVICGSIAVIIPVLLSMDIFGLYWSSILQNIEVAVLAIVGFSLFTTKKPELQ